MAPLTRRRFVQAAGTATVAGTFGMAHIARAQAKARIVIIGGGAGGASVAVGLKRANPALDVTLIEARTTYPTCFHSNLYLGGIKSYASLIQGYDGIAAMGVHVVSQAATAVDTAGKRVEIAGGKQIAYDRLVISPGISLSYDAIEGYTAEAAESMPHAWIAGPQTQTLKAKLAGMHNGATVVMAVPALPYRCPPAPYERACMIAHFLKLYKPKSKLIILDAKRFFIEQEVFQDAFRTLYPDQIELALTDEIDDNRVMRVDAATGEVVTVSGRRIVAEVANIIPPQTAGEIAVKAGCAEGAWCPVEADSFKSAKVADVYVLGDAAQAPDMPKSAASAVSQAGVVVAGIVAELDGKPRPEVSLDSHCWSVVAPDAGVKLAASYKPGDRDGKRRLIAGAIVASTPDESAALRKKSYDDNLAWYDELTGATFPHSSEEDRQVPKETAPGPEMAPGPAPAAAAPAEHPDDPPKPRRRRKRRRG